MAKMLQYLPTGEVSTIFSHLYDDILEKFWTLDVAPANSSYINFGDPTPLSTPGLVVLLIPQLDTA